MILLVVLAVVAATVPLTGGRLTRLADLRLRWPGLALAALGMQIAIINVLAETLPAALAAAAHVLSYVLALAFLVLNRRVRGLLLVGLGGMLNLAAIAANGGVMPASPAALTIAGRSPQAHQFTNSAPVADPRLSFLGDVFAVPAPLPLANVFSVGDVLLVVGIALLLHRHCRPARRA